LNRVRIECVFEIGSKERTVVVKPAYSVNDLSSAADWADAAVARALLETPGRSLLVRDLKDQKILYVQQNAVQNKPDEPSPSFTSEL